MSIKVLIVDDEHSFSAFLGRALARKGYVVSIALNIEQALWMAADQRPDVMLVDWMLKSASNGVDLIQSLRSAGISSRMIMISGYPSEDLKSAVRELGDVVFIAKPFAPQDLIPLIEGVRSRVVGSTPIKQ